MIISLIIYLFYRVVLLLMRFVLVCCFMNGVFNLYITVIMAWLLIKILSWPLLLPLVLPLRISQLGPKAIITRVTKVVTTTIAITRVATTIISLPIHHLNRLPLSRVCLQVLLIAIRTVVSSSDISCALFLLLTLHLQVVIRLTGC